MKRGKFITLDGIDGAGKSSHIGTVVDYVREAKRVEVVSTREPGGTELGEKIRALLLHESMHADTELLLMFAARREHLDKLILPALQRGAWVVSDRFTDASYAYQGGGRGVAAARIALLEQWVQGDVQPDVTLLFDLTAEAARRRLAADTQSARCSVGAPSDRFEAEHAAFFERVREAYLRRAGEFPDRIHVMNAGAPLAEVTHQVTQALQTL